MYLASLSISCWSSRANSLSLSCCWHCCSILFCSSSSPVSRLPNSPLKGHCHELDIFITVNKFFLHGFLCMHWLFSRPFTSFSLRLTIINVLLASLKLLTNFENSYGNPPQNSLLCDWSKFSSAHLLLAAGKINLSQKVSGMILQNHRRLPVSIFSFKIAA
jgi:hypothetical protein